MLRNVDCPASSIQYRALKKKKRTKNERVPVFLVVKICECCILQSFRFLSLSSVLYYNFSFLVLDGWFPLTDLYPDNVHNYFPCEVYSVPLIFNVIVSHVYLQ